MIIIYESKKLASSLKCVYINKKTKHPQAVSQKDSDSCAVVYFFVDTSEGQSKAFKEASLLCVHQPPPLLPLRLLLPPLSPF